MIRNKTLIKGFALVVFMPLFAACSNEEDATVPGGEPQEVQVSIDTRATTDGDTWTWENNDVIGLNVTGIGTSANSFTIPENQTTSGNLCKADFMTYSGDLISTTPSVTLEHRLSKVIVTISDWTDYGETMPEVKDFFIQTKKSITVNGNTVTGDENTIDISPLQDEAAHSYTAIVAPGAGFTITLTVDSRHKNVTYSGTLESGNAYSFNLTLKDNWGTEDQEQEIQ